MQNVACEMSAYGSCVICKLRNPDGTRRKLVLPSLPCGAEGDILHTCTDRVGNILDTCLYGLGGILRPCTDRVGDILRPCTDRVGRVLDTCLRARGVILCLGQWSAHHFLGATRTLLAK